MEKGSHKRYLTLANLAVVWALWSLRIWAVLMSSQTSTQQLSTDWSYITLLNFVKLSTLLIGMGSHRRYAAVITLAVVWALWSFRISFWSELFWWALKEQNSSCLQIGQVLNLLTFWSWTLIKKGSHKRYPTLTTLAVVWAFWSFWVFFWSELSWWALKELNSCCLQIDCILCPVTLLNWALCWYRSVATSDMQCSQLKQWFEHSGPSGSCLDVSWPDELSRRETVACYRLTI